MWSALARNVPQNMKTISPRTDPPAKHATGHELVDHAKGWNKQDLIPVEVSVGPPSGDDRLRSGNDNEGLGPRLAGRAGQAYHGLVAHGMRASLGRVSCMGRAWDMLARRRACRAQDGWLCSKVHDEARRQLEAGAGRKGLHLAGGCC